MKGREGVDRREWDNISAAVYRVACLDIYDLHPVEHIQMYCMGYHTPHEV